MIKTVSCGMTDHLRHTCKLNSITLGKCLLRFLSGLHLLCWFLLSVIMMRFSNTDFTFSPSPLLSLSPILSRVMFVCLCVKCFTYFVISFLLWNVSLNKVERISFSLRLYSLLSVPASGDCFCIYRPLDIIVFHTTSSHFWCIIFAISANLCCPSAGLFFHSGIRYVLASAYSST